MPVSQSDFTHSQACAPDRAPKIASSLPQRTLIALGLGFAIVTTGLIALDPALNVVQAAPDESTASYWLSERKRNGPSQETLNRQAQQRMQAQQIQAQRMQAHRQAQQRRQAQYQQQLRLQQQQQQQLQQQPRQRAEPVRFADLLPWNRVVTITPRALPQAQPSSPLTGPQLVTGVLASFDTDLKPATRRSANPQPAPARVALTASKPKPPALCVRLCDGSYFPAPGTGTATQEDCARACPRAPTRLYKTSNGDISTAISTLDGASYFALPVAMRFSKVRDQTCTCGSSDPMATILSDSTLRRGDRVMTAEGFRLFKGGARPPFSPRNFQSVEQARHLAPRERAVLRSMERAAGVRPGAARRDAFAALSPNWLPTGASAQ